MAIASRPVLGHVPILKPGVPVEDAPVSYPSQFSNLKDLARLPWCELRDGGRLAVKDRSIGPIIDMHTHLAFAFVRPNQVNLHGQPAETDHYLPCCCALDLDVYMNQNFSAERLSDLKRDLTLGSLTAGGMRRTHTIPNLMREMDELGIVHSVLLAIDLPLISSNAVTWLHAAKGQERLTVFGSVHPYMTRKNVKIDEQAHLGARGLKLHPNVQCFRPDDPRAMGVYKLCGERNLPVLLHCGPVGIEPALGRYLTQVRFYEKPIAQNPKTRFVLGHAGALQMEEALDLQCRYSNVYLELSSQSLPHIHKIVAKADPHRIVYGTDWPWYHQAPALAKLLIATEQKRELRHKVLYMNAARLLGLAGERV
jgi:predicted TIM-barrel fold metal-dependent hydrolase